eukprot:gene11601-15494_t
MTLNADPQELAKFSDLAHRWWDTESEFRPLHQINPLRLDWIDQRARVSGKRVLDVGCGGGILSDAMARRGANVLGIDLATKALRGGEDLTAEGGDGGLAVGARHRDASRRLRAMEGGGGEGVGADARTGRRTARKSGSPPGTGRCPPRMPANDAAGASRAPACRDVRCSHVPASCRNAGRIGRVIPVTRSPQDRVTEAASALHAEQFDLKHQGGVGRDHATGATGAVTELRRNNQGALAADLHG